MPEIHQFKLAELFADPSALYERMVNRKGYYAKTPVTEFDAELIATSWTSLGCAMLCVLVHHERRAYIVMLDSVDLTAMRDSLAQMQTSLNTSELLKAGRPNQVFGFGL
jgi:hypothetical protein